MAKTATKIALPELNGDLLMLRIAREIAIDQHDIDKILERAGVTDIRDWYRMQKNPRFQKYLQDEMVAWNSATNAPERVKIKSSAMIEEWLPEAFTQMHNPDAPLLHRNDLAKLIARLGGMDKGGVGVDGVGERFSVTINMGADHKLNFDKQQLPSKVIDGEVA